MREWPWMCVVVVWVTAVGCGGGGGATPEETFESYKGAMANKDFERVWDMLSPASQRLFDKDAKEIAERAAKSEGPGREDLLNKAKLMDMTLDDVRKLDGKGLFVGLCKMGSQEGKEEWDKLPRGQRSRVERDGDRAKVYLKVDGVEQTQRPLPLVRSGTRWQIDMTGVK